MRNENKYLNNQYKSLSEEHNDVVISNKEKDLELNKNVTEKNNKIQEIKYWKEKYSKDMIKMENEIKYISNKINEKDIEYEKL